MESRRVRLILCLATLCATLAPHVVGESWHIEFALHRRSHETSAWVRHAVQTLTLEEKVGQLIQLRYFADYSDFDSAPYQHLREQIRKYHVGSVAFNMHIGRSGILRCSALDAARVANQLQRDSELPLLLAADFERGTASRLKDVPDFPWPMAFGAAGDVIAAEQFGAITAREARAVGVHWVLAPVADVNSNPANPIINVRSFGEDPEQVGDLAAAFIRGAHKNGLLVTAKHFPGHGDSSVDSHRGVPMVGSDLPHLQKIELVPFKKAIDAGVDSILLAHASVPAIEPDPGKIATISSKVINELLRKQLGFKGVVLTDAMEMAAVAKLYDPQLGNPGVRAAIDAIKAGSDVIMWPTDLDATFNGIVEAVRRGEIPESRIDESVRKILGMKAAVGLDKSRFVDLEKAMVLTNEPADRDFAQSVADNAITLVRDNGRVLPLQELTTHSRTANVPSQPPLETSRLVVLLLAQNFETDSGKEFENALKARQSDTDVFRVDRFSANAMSARIIDAVTVADKVIVVAYVVPREAKQVVVSGRLLNSFGLLGPSGRLLEQVLASAADKTAVIALGSPYLIENFPRIQTYICTFAIASTSERSAVKALFGEIQNNSRLPVGLPGIAARGFYLSWPAKTVQ